MIIHIYLKYGYQKNYVDLKKFAINFQQISIKIMKSTNHFILK